MAIPCQYYVEAGEGTIDAKQVTSPPVWTGLRHYAAARGVSSKRSEKQHPAHDRNFSEHFLTACSMSAMTPVLSLTRELGLQKFVIFSLWES